jgi:acyl dehydratase
MKHTLQVGDKATLRKAFTTSEVELFAQISGDDNPLHMDQEFAEKTPFGQPIVHGLLIASLFSGLLGGKFPGHGTIYLGQNISFKTPVFLNEPIEASVEIIKIREDKPIITLKTLCVKDDGTIAIEGEAVVKVD